MHTFVEDSQLERKSEKDREKYVRETAKVEEIEKLDKKRSTLDWTPEKPLTKTRRVWSSSKNG